MKTNPPSYSLSKYTLFFLFLLSSQWMSAQRFVLLPDVSGIDRTPYVAALEAATDSLIASFPVEYQDSFKVFDYGFYLLDGAKEGGNPAAWQQGIDMAAAQSPYFLLFGKQTEPSGVYSKFWVELRLPSGGDFSCFDENYFQLVEYKISTFIISTFDKLEKIPFSAITSQLNGIDTLTKQIATLVECCEPLDKQRGESCSVCDWKSNDVIGFLGSKKFEQDTIYIQNISSIIDPNCLCLGANEEQSVERTGQNYSLKRIIPFQTFMLDSNLINIDSLLDELESIGQLYGLKGLSFFGAITGNAIFCNTSNIYNKRSGLIEDFQKIENQFNSSDIGIWIHINHDSDNAVLSVLTKGIGGNVLLGCNNFPQYCSKLQKIVNELEKTPFYNKIVNGFCKDNELDFWIVIAELPHNNGQPIVLSEVIKQRVLGIYVNASFFTQNNFCTEELGYLKIAYTILHECIHAELNRRLYKIHMKSLEERRMNLGYKNYNTYFKDYLRFGTQNRNYPTWYTEHRIILEFYSDDLVRTVKMFNNNFGAKKNYFQIAFGFEYKIDGLGYINSIYGTNYLSWENPDLIERMKNDLNLLKTNPTFPCLGY